MKKLVYAALAFSPVLAFAQSADTSVGKINTLLNSLKPLINTVIAILIGLEIIYFIWGLLQYLRTAGDQKQADLAKSHMLWGIIAIAVTVSIFGLISWLQNTLGINGGTITPPTIQ